MGPRGGIGLFEGPQLQTASAPQLHVRDLRNSARRQDHTSFSNCSPGALLGEMVAAALGKSVLMHLAPYQKSEESNSPAQRLHVANT